MAISDVVVGNITSLYLGVIVTMKAFGLISGRSYSGVVVLLVSTSVVLLLLVATLSWDVSRKAATYASSSSSSSSSPPHHPYPIHHHHHAAPAAGGGPLLDQQFKYSCRGGICWHGTVSVRSTVSQVRFRLPVPEHHPAPASSGLL